VFTESELNVLKTFLGGGTDTGSKMKETETTHWASPNALTTNVSGWTGLPGAGVTMRVFSPALVLLVTGGLQRNPVQQLQLMLCYTGISLFWIVIATKKPMECLSVVLRTDTFPATIVFNHGLPRA